MTDITDDVIDQIDAYFRSGNSVPVTRATIKFEEWQAAKALLQRQRERQAVAVPEGEAVLEYWQEPHGMHSRFWRSLNGYVPKVGDKLFAASPADTVKQDAVIPAGWKLVPIEPTQAMCQAGQIKAREWPTFPLRILPIYQAMLSAAPPADTVKQDDAMRKAGEELLAAYTEPFPMGTEGQEAQDAWGLRQKNAVEAMRQALANNGDCPHPIEEELTK
jgi:hypothetical protein